MTTGRLAVWFGVLELAFVLLVAGVLPRLVFLLWGSAVCVLMVVDGRRSA